MEITREQAIAVLVEMDVARWGEQEREASQRIHGRDRQTIGIAVNGIASRMETHDDAAWLEPARALLSTAEWRKLANSLLSNADRCVLRQGS